MSLSSWIWCGGWRCGWLTCVVVLALLLQWFCNSGVAMVLQLMLIDPRKSNSIVLWTLASPISHPKYVVVDLVTTPNSHANTCDSTCHGMFFFNLFWQITDVVCSCAEFCLRHVSQHYIVHCFCLRRCEHPESLHSEKRGTKSIQQLYCQVSLRHGVWKPLRVFCKGSSELVCNSFVVFITFSHCQWWASWTDDKSGKHMQVKVESCLPVIQLCIHWLNDCLCFPIWHTVDMR